MVSESLSSKRKWLKIGVLIFTVLFIVNVQPALAVHTPLFELDGNAIQNAIADDWYRVLILGTGADSTHVGPLVDIPDRTFTTGGSKDINDINQWRHTTNTGGPDKDALTHAFVAAYTRSDGHQILYFGADRFDNSGNAQMGFWFFRNKVSLITQGPNAGRFNGTHNGSMANPSIPRDILVLTNFVNGGSTSMIEVYEWVGSGGSHGPLNRIAQGQSSGTAVCNSAVFPFAGDEACAITNQGGEGSPWPYTPKSGPANVYPSVSFFEGGIDLTALGLQGCIAGFLAESRSSQSENAVLKDFILGETLNTCGITVTKQCTAAVNAAGTGVIVNFSGEVRNTGPLTVTNLIITDNPGVVDAHPTTLAPAGLSGDRIIYTGSYNSTSITNTDTVSVTGNIGELVVSATQSAECVAAVTKALSVTGSCTAVVNAGGTGTVVGLQGEVCNNGSVSLANIAVNLSGPTGPIPITTIASLGPNACQTYTGSYPSTSTSFTETITASGSGALGSGTVSNSGGASCSATVTSGLTVTKSCETDLQIVNNMVAVKVNFSGQVCNTGNTQVTGLSLVNDKPTSNTAINLSSTSLAPGACLPYSGSYTPTNISSGNLLSPGSVIFTDTVNASGTAALVGSVGATSGPQSCPLCN